MHSSLATMAQLTFNTTFDATAILNYRKVLKAKGEAYGMEKVTINDMILYAVSRVLLHHKDLNAYFADDKMTLFNNVHLGVATDTERGLMVPTVFYANRMSLKEISDQAKIVCSACRDGACNPDLLKGATFTVSNLGSMGVESFTPVINPPQTGILGVCSVTQPHHARSTARSRPIRPWAFLITFDHRAIDGAPAGPVPAGAAAQPLKTSRCSWAHKIRQEEGNCTMYDLIVLGGGPGGYLAAERAAAERPAAWR